MCDHLCASGLCVGGVCGDRSSVPCDTNADGAPDIDCERDYCPTLSPDMVGCQCFRSGRVGSGLTRTCWPPDGYFECASTDGQSFAICAPDRFCLTNGFGNAICSTTP